jgi:hypothetical protein
MAAAHCRPSIYFSQPWKSRLFVNIVRGSCREVTNVDVTIGQFDVLVVVTGKLPGQRLISRSFEQRTVTTAKCSFKRACLVMLHLRALPIAAESLAAITCALMKFDSLRPEGWSRGKCPGSKLWRC